MEDIEKILRMLRLKNDPGAEMNTPYEELSRGVGGLRQRFRDSAFGDAMFDRERQQMSPEEIAQINEERPVNKMIDRSVERISDFGTRAQDFFGGISQDAYNLKYSGDQAGSNDDQYSRPNLTPFPQKDKIFTTQPDSLGESTTPTVSGASDVPSSGKIALAKQTDDIDSMLSAMTRKKEEDSFGKFLRLAVARGAMSGNPNVLAGLVQGAGQATFDVDKDEDSAETRRFNALKELANYRQKQAELDQRATNYDAENELRRAQARAYNEGRSRGSSSALPAGFGSASDKALAELVGSDEYDSFDPVLKADLRIRARQIFEENDRQITPIEAATAAFEQLVGSTDNIDKIQGGLFSLSPDVYGKPGYKSFRATPASGASSMNSTLPSGQKVARPLIPADRLDYFLESNKDNPAGAEAALLRELGIDPSEVR